MGSQSNLYGGYNLNRSQALQEWNRAVDLARVHRKISQIQPYIPPQNAGVKRLDTATCKVLQLLGLTREEAKEKGFECDYQWDKAKKSSAKKKEKNYGRLHD